MNGFHKMIVKMGENPGFEEWASNDKAVKAIKMKEDFLVETSLGYLQGKRGDFLVEIAPNVRFPCSEDAFIAAHRRLEPHTEERRFAKLDRRKNDGV